MTWSTDTSRSTEIRIPRETVNDDVVTVAAWNVKNGDRVRAGECVVEIETSKSILEVAAETEGYLQIVQPAGAEVPVGELIGRIHADPAPQQPAPQEGTPPGQGGPDGSPGYTISRKAQRLLEEHGIEPSAFAGRGLVREVDVIRYLEQRLAGGDGATEAAEPAAQAGSWQGVGLFGDAGKSARERGRGLPWLFWHYFWNNWLLGNLVRVAPRGVTELLHRMRGVKMGRDCFVDPSATLETAYPENVTLGDDVRVTAGAIVMTHIKAPQYLRDTGIVPVVLEPVVLEDHSFIGVNAMVMPGVRVGEASVVASGAVVVADVPAYTMVAGNPAKVIKRFPKPERDE